MPHFWLGPWQWNSPAGREHYWSAPTGAIGCLDLRSIPHCGQRTKPEGFGVFVTPNGVDLDSSYENFGSDLLSPWGPSARARWQSAAKLPRTMHASNLRDAIWETLTVQSDPIGDDRCMPLVPTIGRNYELWMSGTLIHAKRFHAKDPEAAPMLDMLRRHYRQLRRDSLDGISHPQHYRKALGDWVRKYGLHYRTFQPSDVPDESDLQPETTITDDFNTADSSTLGPNLTWAETVGDLQIVSNRVRPVSTSAVVWNFARAESDLSSTDHYAQALDYRNTTGASFNDFKIGAVAIRFSSSADTCYHGSMDNTTTSNTDISKRVTGTRTSLTTGTSAGAASNTIKLSGSGTSLTFYIDGSQNLTVTDSSITTGTRCGIGILQDSNVQHLELDDFQASDLAGAALTGTAISPVTNEINIRAGGQTIIITITGDTFVASGSTFDNQRQNIINGMDSAQAEGAGWDAVVKAVQSVGGVVRTSATVCTITLDAFPTYDITVVETITVTVPGTALTGGVDFVAAPSFQVNEKHLQFAPFLKG